MRQSLLFVHRRGFNGFGVKSFDMYKYTPDEKIK